MTNGRIVLPGGSGFLGQSLATDLVAHGYEPVVLSRSSHPDRDGVAYAEWDGRTLGPWADLLDGARAVVNLAGKSVNCRYTPANRREIVASRVDSVRVLGEAVRRCARPPEAFVQAASLAIYGDTTERCDETAPPGEGFATEVCVRWEAEFAALDLPQTRKVLLRIGFALGSDGGALETLARLTRWGLGGTVGSGRQGVSWLHLDDLNRMVRWSIEQDGVEGTYNATGPQPVSNAAFMRALRHALGRPWSPPAPAWAVHIGARVMGTEPSLALTGRYGVPARFEAADFPFAYRELGPALDSLL